MRSQAVFEIVKSTNDGANLLTDFCVYCFSEDQIVKRDIGGIGDFNDQINGRIPAAGFYAGEVLTADMEVFREGFLSVTKG